EERAAQMIVGAHTDLKRGLLLNSENVLQVTVEVVCSELKACGAINQLRGDANTIGSFADAAFKQITHTKLAADLLNVLLFAFEARNGGARSDLKTVNAGELGDDLFRDTVDEVLVFGVSA